MEKKKTRKRRIHVLLIIIGLSICTTGFFFWRNYKYKLANKKLDELVTGKSGGLYQLSYENLVINEALGNISANHIEMIPDSSVLQSMKERQAEPKALFYIHIPLLSISGVKTPKALLNKEISAHLINIKNAEIEIRINYKSANDHDSAGKSNMGAELYQQLLGNLKSIQADSIILENAALTHSGQGFQKTQVQSRRT